MVYSVHIFLVQGRINIIVISIGVNMFRLPSPVPMIKRLSFLCTTRPLAHAA